MQNLGRKLGGMERLFYQQNMLGSSNMVSVLFYEGTLDLDKVPSALEQLLIAFPSLANRIVADPVLRFVPAEGTIPYQIEVREDDEHFRRLARTEVLRQYDKERIHVTLLVGEGRGEIIIAIDHVLADAKSLYVVCEYFLSAMNGRQLSYVPMGEAWEKRLPATYRGWSGIKKTYGYVKKTFRNSPERAEKHGFDVKHVNTISHGFRLDKTTVDKLKKTTQQHDTNLNALFCATAMLTAHQLFNEQKSGTFCLNTPVSVREMIEPKASREEMGMFLSAFLQWHQLSKDTDVWQLSRDILHKIKSGVSAGEPIILGWLARGPKKPLLPKPDKHRERFTQSITVSNPGKLDSFEHLPNAKIVGYRNLGSLWAQESITIVVLGYGDSLFIEAETSVERLGHFPDAAKRMAEGIEKSILELLQ